MAVITAAVVAVGAAVATTTMATVATAVVAVSVAVGTVGAVVGAVGAAIGNEDLMFAGQIMGYVGMAGGLAGGVLGGIGAVTGNAGLTFGQGFADTYASYSQHVSNAWKSGVGSWFSGGDKVAGAAGQTGKATGEVTQAGVNPLDHATGGTGPATPFKGAELNPINTGAVEGLTPTTGGAATPMTAATGTVAPTAPTVNAPSAMAQMNTAGGWGTATTPSTGGGIVSGAGKAISDMPDWMKYSLMTTGAQGVTGLASGYFQGEQAEQMMEQKRLEMDRNENQRQLLNRQANEVPLIQFKPRY